MPKSKYGVKIKNYKVGSIYEYNLGVRNGYHFTNAMFTNSLFLYFLRILFNPIFFQLPLKPLR